MLMKCFIFLIFCICVVLSQQQSKLIMVNELFRHGARYPVYPNQIDGSNYTFAQHSFGQLTTNGKKMHYLLGQQLYKTYWAKLFNGTKYMTDYNQSKFYIKSTDVNRTIESVQSQMMGILQNITVLNLTKDMTQFSKPQWNEDITVDEGDVFPKARTFHPIAIHVEKGGSQAFNRGDFLRTYSPQNCPNQLIWEQQNRQSSKVQQIYKNQKIVAAIDALSKQFGKKLSFAEAANFYDNYQCAKYMGRQYYPVFEQQEYRLALEYIHTLDMYINLYANPKQIRATATGFFNQTVLNMKSILSNSEAVQWNIYSAHDTTVGNMLAALNLASVDCIYDAFLKNSTANSDTCVSQYPIYTSNLIFELYQNRTFMIRYNGEYKKIPFCKWQKVCAVEKFFSWYDDFKDQNYLSTCGVNDKDAEIYFSIAAAEFILLLAIILGILVKFLQKRLKPHKTAEFNNTKAGSDKKNQDINSEKQSSSMIKQSLLSEP